MKVLVTGAKGQLGYDVMNELVKRGHTAIGADITDFDINDDLDGYEAEKSMLVLNLTDERNALERVMLNFSHLEKEAVKIDDMHYQITLKYDKSDETEILIRILSFGPMIKVVSPDSFIRQLKSRIDKQQICGV